MSRDALVVGINTYTHSSLGSLGAPAEDAEAIAQQLYQNGSFRTVHRLPEVEAEDGLRVGQKTKVTLNELEDSLVQLFNPSGQNLPETVLFFFSGHGVRKDKGIQEGFLATSDADPNAGFYGLSLQWLRRLLQESPIRQQIIWLDCCYSGELLNFAEADPGDRGKGRDRCFIAASRGFEAAYEETGGKHGVLTGGLLQGLDPKRQPEGLVTNFTLIDFLNQYVTKYPQKFLYANSGGEIILTGNKVVSTNPVVGGTCPYKGLEYFDCNEEDAKFFYGRTVLTDQLLEKIRQGNFLAVMGASGSGKSSVVRAGLLYQLKLGQRLSGSDRWVIKILRLGNYPNLSEHPLCCLAQVFVDEKLPQVEQASQLRKVDELLVMGEIGLGYLVQAFKSERFILVIDQFEEVFTLCKDDKERERFFECLLNAAQILGNAFTLILTLRADFYGKCAEREYAGLAREIQDHLVTVIPMSNAELEQAIVEPAKQVNLEIERELVTQIILDVANSPGSLPLLAYTLRELWQQRTVERLMLSAYARLGGIQGTLQKRATEVYKSLSPAEQQTAKHIFLELTQLGEGTEDTRRRVLQQDLITLKQSQALVDGVIQKLSDEKVRLLVTSELIKKGSESGRVAMVDVAHETLIRHWTLLREWLDENRDAMRRKRKLEEDALEWRDQAGELLQGKRLREAKAFQKEQANRFQLSTLAENFITQSVYRKHKIAGLRFVIISATILAIAIPIVGTSEWLTIFVNDRGQEKYDDGDMQAAIGLYNLALTIRPGYKEALYNRGRAYEDQKDFNKARADYEVAKSQGYISAFVQLAHLSIVEEHNYLKALKLSEEGLKVSKNTNAIESDISQIQYPLLKNLGWARLELGKYREAEDALQEAISLDMQRGSAYCILAQVFKAHGSQTKEKENWIKCKNFGDPSHPDEKGWIDLANIRLKEIKQ